MGSLWRTVERLLWWDDMKPCTAFARNYFRFGQGDVVFLKDGWEATVIGWHEAKHSFCRTYFRFSNTQYSQHSFHMKQFVLSTKYKIINELCVFICSRQFFCPKILAVSVQYNVLLVWVFTIAIFFPLFTDETGLEDRHEVYHLKCLENLEQVLANWQWQHQHTRVINRPGGYMIYTMWADVSRKDTFTVWNLSRHLKQEDFSYSCLLYDVPAAIFAFEKSNLMGLRYKYCLYVFLFLCWALNISTHI